MIKKIITGLFVLFCLVSIVYLSLPNFDFPVPPPDALQSQELGDTENLAVRRAYFTNLTRAEVLDWYKNQINHSKFMGIPFPTFLVNYPPEESQTIIRDQTRSTFLQEAVNPFRESIYINGFEPTEAKDAIFIEGRDWRQKIIIRYVSGSILLRLGIFILTATLMVVMYSAWYKSLRKNNG